jgi:hypothetical protein
MRSGSVPSGERPIRSAAIAVLALASALAFGLVATPELVSGALMAAGAVGAAVLVLVGVAGMLTYSGRRPGGR